MKTFEINFTEVNTSEISAQQRVFKRDGKEIYPEVRESIHKWNLDPSEPCCHVFVYTVVTIGDITSEFTNRYRVKLEEGEVSFYDARDIVFPCTGWWK